MVNVSFLHDNPVPFLEMVTVPLLVQAAILLKLQGTEIVCTLHYLVIVAYLGFKILDRFPNTILEFSEHYFAAVTLVTYDYIISITLPA